MANIEIRTSQNVVIEYELASLMDRFLALIIDLAAFYISYFILFTGFSFVFARYLDNWGLAFFYLLTISGFLIYLLLFEALSGGQTLGKKMMKLRVVRPDGREAGLGDYLIRAIFMLIDFFLSLGVLGAMLIGSTTRSQRFGDLAAGTTVVRLQNKTNFTLEDLSRIVTLDSYQPQYPSVKQLTEEDVLVLKQLLRRYSKWPNAAHASALNLAVDNVSKRLGIPPPKREKTEFLKTVIRDYIVLTR